MGGWEVGGTMAPNEYGSIQFIYNREEQTDMDSHCRIQTKSKDKRKRFFPFM